MDVGKVSRQPMSPSYNVRDQGGGWLDELVIPVPAWLLELGLVGCKGPA